MGPPLARERTIADGRRHSVPKNFVADIMGPEDTEAEAEYIGEKLKKILSNKSTKQRDLEAGPPKARSPRQSTSNRRASQVPPTRFSWTLNADDLQLETQSIASSVSGVPRTKPSLINQSQQHPRKVSFEQDLSVVGLPSTLKEN